MPNPEDDFQGYMEAKEQATHEWLEHEARLERHRIWRETTWGGFAVRQMQAVGDHFAPFFSALADAMRNDSSAGSVALMMLIRLVIIFFAIGMFYVGASLVQKLIGKDFVGILGLSYCKKFTIFFLFWGGRNRI